MAGSVCELGAEHDGAAERVEAADQPLGGAILIDAVEVIDAAVGKGDGALEHVEGGDQDPVRDSHSGLHRGLCRSRSDSFPLPARSPRQGLIDPIDIPHCFMLRHRSDMLLLYPRYACVFQAPLADSHGDRMDTIAFWLAVIGYIAVWCAIFSPPRVAGPNGGACLKRSRRKDRLFRLLRWSRARDCGAVGAPSS